MELKKLPPKDIVDYFRGLFGVSEINWPQQIRIVKKLLEDYSDTQIIYALNYYKNKGVNVYSIGYLKGRMKDPMSMLTAEKHVQRNEGSGRRNQERIGKLRSAEYRAEYPQHLFTESGEDD